MRANETYLRAKETRYQFVGRGRQCSRSLLNNFDGVIDLILPSKEAEDVSRLFFKVDLERCDDGRV